MGEPTVEFLDVLGVMLGGCAVWALVGGLLYEWNPLGYEKSRHGDRVGFAATWPLLPLLVGYLPILVGRAIGRRIRRRARGRGVPRAVVTRACKEPPDAP